MPNPSLETLIARQPKLRKGDRQSIRLAPICIQSKAHVIVAIYFFFVSGEQAMHDEHAAGSHRSMFYKFSPVHIAIIFCIKSYALFFDFIFC